ncbi:unnamed protein product [Camellia sinensis]
MNLHSSEIGKVLGFEYKSARSDLQVSRSQKGEENEKMTIEDENPNRAFNNGNFISFNLNQTWKFSSCVSLGNGQGLRISHIEK